MPVVQHRALRYPLIGASLLLAAVYWVSPQVGFSAQVESSFEREWPRTDFSRRTVDLAEIRSGGPPKDGIPAIDRPVFGPVERASGWLDSAEPVIVLERAGRGEAGREEKAERREQQAERRRGRRVSACGGRWQYD